MNKKFPTDIERDKVIASIHFFISSKVGQLNCNVPLETLVKVNSNIYLSSFLRSTSQTCSTHCLKVYRNLSIKKNI